MQTHVKKNALVLVISLACFYLVMLISTAIVDSAPSNKSAAREACRSTGRSRSETAACYEEYLYGHRHNMLTVYSEHPQIITALGVIAVGLLATLSLCGVFFGKELERVTVPTATAKKQNE